MYAWPAPGAPAGTARAWPAIAPPPGSGSWRWTGPAVKTGAARANRDPLDAVSAARAALSGRAAGAPRGPDGQAGAIHALMVAKRTARAHRTQTINQARALTVTGPGGIRTRFPGQTPAELAGLAGRRPRPASMARCHPLRPLRELGRRAHYPDAQLTHE